MESVTASCGTTSGTRCSAAATAAPISSAVGMLLFDATDPDRPGVKISGPASPTMIPTGQRPPDPRVDAWGQTFPP